MHCFCFFRRKKMFLCETEWQESKNGISSEKKKKKKDSGYNFFFMCKTKWKKHKWIKKKFHKKIFFSCVKWSAIFFFFFFLQFFVCFFMTKKAFFQEKKFLYKYINVLFHVWIFHFLIKKKSFSGKILFKKIFFMSCQKPNAIFVCLFFFCVCVCVGGGGGKKKKKTFWE